MPPKSSALPWSDPWIAERAIVLQVLRDDHDWRWSSEELQAEVFDIAPSMLADALERLRQHGIVVPCDTDVVASRCALHMDELGMVSV